MSDTRDQVFLIEDTGTTSNVVQKAHCDIMGLVASANVTVAPHGCPTANGTFGACKDQDQAALSYALVANEPQPVKIDEWPWPFIKLVASGAVTGDVTITPIFRDLR